MWLTKYFKTSVGRKQLMAITGLIWTGFLVSHLAGNFLILAGADAFNAYTKKLMDLGPLLYVAEAFLLLTFVLHVFLAIQVTKHNKKARGPVGYHVKKNKGGSHFAAATMIYSGILILVYLVYHIWTLKFGAEYVTTIDGEATRDLYRLLLERFANPLYSGFYLITMVVLGFHLAHGFQSTFQTLGLNHPKYTPLIQCTSKGLAIFLALGFSVCTIAAYVLGQGGNY
jgi:succinate dehydrogenase / fumarate reductase cytochrome b subunit